MVLFNKSSVVQSTTVKLSFQHWTTTKRRWCQSEQLSVISAIILNLICLQKSINFYLFKKKEEKFIFCNLKTKKKTILFMPKFVRFSSLNIFLPNKYSKILSFKKILHKVWNYTYIHTHSLHSCHIEILTSEFITGYQVNINLYKRCTNRIKQ